MGVKKKLVPIYIPKLTVGNQEIGTFDPNKILDQVVQTGGAFEFDNNDVIRGNADSVEPLIDVMQILQNVLVVFEEDQTRDGLEVIFDESVRFSSCSEEQAA